jgi:hypothetical protein
MSMSRAAAALIIAASVFASGCATIVHSGPRKVPVASTPPGAKVTIYDRSNAMVLTNTTPFTATLTPRAGYFKGQNYRLVFEMPGYKLAEVRLQSTVSGWYFGNILIGGLLGMLIVDPATGAMYNLSPQKIEQPLESGHAEVIKQGSGVMVVLLSQTTEQEREKMVRIN